MDKRLTHKGYYRAVDSQIPELRQTTRTEFLPLGKELVGNTESHLIFVLCEHSEGDKTYIYPGR